MLPRDEAAAASFGSSGFRASINMGELIIPDKTETKFGIRDGINREDAEARQRD